jgi:chloride channel protein, CIC family
VPAPLIGRRIASGRGPTEQPNACGDDVAALTPRFWAAVVLAGGAGLFGAAMMALLTAVEDIGFGYDSGSFSPVSSRRPRRGGRSRWASPG